MKGKCLHLPLTWAACAWGGLRPFHAQVMQRPAHPQAHMPCELVLCFTGGSHFGCAQMHDLRVILVAFCMHRQDGNAHTAVL